MWQWGELMTTRIISKETVKRKPVKKMSHVLLFKQQNYLTQKLPLTIYLKS